MKKIYMIMIMLTLLVTASGIIFKRIQYEQSGYIDGQAAVRVMYTIEANNHLEKLTNNIRFAYDTSVLPSESYAALDSVIAVIKTYEQEGFRYIFRIHSHQQNRSDTQETAYAQAVAAAIKQYVVNAGISGDIIDAVGVGRKNRLCLDETEPDCFHQNNRLEIHVD
ncbi:OmpA family protein [Sphingobacterium sp. DN00404]|uniref:OmpA family protein n=1 Tax=Sphingobacterium micropteri TaxID=2763501 RepID=A0ABR7YRT3_9SPHI|nr:OmpA family protein [Sphingobacterium micropteri]MBD1433926.1 OmpA family protein [Sphingobacterium micropteri]